MRRCYHMEKENDFKNPYKKLESQIGVSILTIYFLPYVSKRNVLHYCTGRMTKTMLHSVPSQLSFCPFIKHKPKKIEAYKNKGNFQSAK